MFKKILYRIAVFLDVLKDNLVTTLIKILAVLLILMILHNVLKMGELSNKYTGNYKKLYQIYEDKMMNIYEVGQGENTIVILPGFGSQFPIMQYKTLAEGLKDNYRIVIIEYFGYGYSMSLKDKERTNENITNEIKIALETIGVNQNCILMPHSSSNIYAMYFANKYPELVKGIISIDGIYSNEIKDKYYDEKISNDVANIKITSVVELSGFERILSYVKEDTFYINKMRENPEIFSNNDIKVYRNRIASSYLTRTMINEISKLKDNMNEVSEYKYSTTLPVLEILAKDTVKEYENYKSQGAEKNLEELAKEPITNEEIQKIVTIDGNHMLQFSNTEELLNQIKQFLQTF